MSSLGSESKKEKFGRVFLIACDKDNKEEHQLKPIRTACFSNLDWRWYDVCGDIHSKFKEHAEKSFSVGFKLTNLNSEGDSDSFEVRLRLPSKLGAIGAPHMERLKEVQKMERDLATQLHFISHDVNDPAGKFLEETSTAALLILMTPGKKLIEESNFLLHLIAFIYFNELVENNKSSAVSELRYKVPYRIISAIPKASAEILKGISSSSIGSTMNLVSIAGSGSVPISAMFELQRIYSSYLKLNKSIYEEALKFGSPDEAQPFIQVLLECSESLFLQMSQEWDVKMDPSAPSVTMSVGSAVGPTTLASEAIALQCWVRVREEIRSSILFKQFIQEIATHTKKVYDLVAFNKEMEPALSAPPGKDHAGCRNEVYYLYKVCGWSLETALQKIMADANECMIRIGEIGKLLLQLYDDDEGLADYIQIAHEAICGYIKWLGFTQYYHSNLVFDCYVEENDRD